VEGQRPRGRASAGTLVSVIHRHSHTCRSIIFESISLLSLMMCYHVPRMVMRAREQVPVSGGHGRVLALATLSDDSIHVLMSGPLTLHSYFPQRGSGGYHRSVLIDLEDFLPTYEVPDSTLQMVPMIGLHQIVVFAPTRNMLVVIAFDKLDEPSEDGMRTAPETVPTARASAFLLQAPNARTSHAYAYAMPIAHATKCAYRCKCQCLHHH
jgi:hypothetical protein